MAYFLLLIFLFDLQFFTKLRNKFNFCAYFCLLECVASDVCVCYPLRTPRNEIFQTLRSLIRFIPKLPPQAAFVLYNYLIGTVYKNQMCTLYIRLFFTLNLPSIVYHVRPHHDLLIRLHHVLLVRLHHVLLVKLHQLVSQVHWQEPVMSLLTG